MKKNQMNKMLFGAAAVVLLLLFTAPVWKITLEAPQYPDGVHMHIWINKIGGKEKGTLQNVNILNHYVGMKHIDPESIPELGYFPFVIIGMSVIGIILAFKGNGKWWISWAVLLVILGCLGIFDFYLWEYNYGHNLSPEAPIKIPGMAYQPPLFGSKMLLNFNAKSYPGLGSLFIAISIFLAFAVGLFQLKSRKA